MQRKACHNKNNGLKMKRTFPPGSHPGFGKSSMGSPPPPQPPHVFHLMLKVINITKTK